MPKQLDLRFLNLDYVLNKAKPRPPEINLDIALPDNWLDQLIALLVKSSLKDEVQEAESEALEKPMLNAIKNRHINPQHYNESEALTRELELLYRLVSAKPNKNLYEIIYRKLRDDIYECEDGFHNRVAESISLFAMPTNFLELLTSIRLDYVNAVTYELVRTQPLLAPQGIHLKNDVYEVAHQLVQTPRLNKKDKYHSIIYGGETIHNELVDYFNKKYQLFSIINAVIEKIQSILISQGYLNFKEEGYAPKESDRFADLITLLLGIESRSAYKKCLKRNANGLTTDISIEGIGIEILRLMLKNNALLLNEEQAIALNEVVIFLDEQVRYQDGQNEDEDEFDNLNKLISPPELNNAILEILEKFFFDSAVGHEHIVDMIAFFSSILNKDSFAKLFSSIKAYNLFYYLFDSHSIAKDKTILKKIGIFLADFLLRILKNWPKQIASILNSITGLNIDDQQTLFHLLINQLNDADFNGNPTLRAWIEPLEALINEKKHFSSSDPKNKLYLTLVEKNGLPFIGEFLEAREMGFLIRQLILNKHDLINDIPKLLNALALLPENYPISSLFCNKQSPIPHSNILDLIINIDDLVILVQHGVLHKNAIIPVIKHLISIREGFITKTEDLITMYMFLKNEDFEFIFNKIIPPEDKGAFFLALDVGIYKLLIKTFTDVKRLIDRFDLSPEETVSFLSALKNKEVDAHIYFYNKGEEDHDGPADQQGAFVACTDFSDFDKTRSNVIQLFEVLINFLETSPPGIRGNIIQFMGAKNCRYLLSAGSRYLIVDTNENAHKVRLQCLMLIPLLDDAGIALGDYSYDKTHPMNSLIKQYNLAKPLLDAAKAETEKALIPLSHNAEKAAIIGLAKLFEVYSKTPKLGIFFKAPPHVGIAKRIAQWANKPENTSITRYLDFIRDQMDEVKYDPTGVFAVLLALARAHRVKQPVQISANIIIAESGFQP